MRQLVHYRVDDELALIGMASPPLNALDARLRGALWRACEQAAADPAVRAIVLYGADGLFSAGSDPLEQAAADVPNLPTLLVRLSRVDKPLIAAIGDQALDSGLELALACGYRIGSADARLGLPGTARGRMPAAGATQRLPRLIGAESALNLILSGRRITGAHAHFLQMLDRLADSDDNLLEAACAYARELLIQQAPARPSAPYARPGSELPDGFFTWYRTEHSVRWRTRRIPHLILAAVEAACLLPLEEGLAREQALRNEAIRVGWRRYA